MAKNNKSMTSRVAILQRIDASTIEFVRFEDETTARRTAGVLFTTLHGVSTVLDRAARGANGVRSQGVIPGTRFPSVLLKGITTFTSAKRVTAHRAALTAQSRADRDIANAVRENSKAMKALGL